MYSLPADLAGYQSSYGGVYGAATAPGLMGVMGYGGPGSMHSHQLSARLNIPVEIAHVRDGVSVSRILIPLNSTW